MSRYRKVDTRVWVDEKFRKLSADAQRFFLYLLTSPHSTAWGAYVLDDLYIMVDLKLSQEDVVRLWKEVLSTKMARRDINTRVVLFDNWFKYNLPSNDKTSTACINGLSSLPRSTMLTKFLSNNAWIREKLANMHLTVSSPHPKRGKVSTEQGALSTEQEQEPARAREDVPEQAGEKKATAFDGVNNDKKADEINLLRDLRKTTAPDMFAKILSDHGYSEADLEEVHSAGSL